MPTTKEEVRAKTIWCINHLQDWLPEKLDEVLNKGGFDFDGIEDNESFPKDIMVAVGEEISFQYRRISPIQRKLKRRLDRIGAAI